MGRKKPLDYALREHCGAFGVYSFSQKSVAYDIYLGMMNLQHRGQDSAGAATSDGKTVETVRELGFVANVLDEKAVAKLKGFAGIGHVRYPTIGAGGIEDAQPFSATVHGKTFALAHNGNIANYGKVRKEMEDAGTIFHSFCDAELILAAFVQAYDGKQDYFYAAEELMKKVDGAYSVVIVTSDAELIAFRDPQAIRPLCWGRDDDRIVFASESVALDIIKCKLQGDLAPGEIAVVDKNGMRRETATIAQKPRHCMFEYVYFSRPDSKIENKWVYEARYNLGRALAKAAPVQADIVVAVPDTARSAAAGYSHESGIPVEEGLIKNRYIGRTFIMPSQKKREDAVRLKLNAVRHVLSGKRVVLIDDSIVRGTTAAPIIKLVREAGAKEIHLRITCPPVIGPCFYGVDMPTYKELVANNKSVEEIRKMSGADSLVYQTAEDLVAAIGLKKEDLCMACINGQYPTPFGEEISKKIKEAKTEGGIRLWEEKG